MSNIARAMLLSGIMSSMFDPQIERVVKSNSKPLKKCLYCGKEHSHNNSFCSSDCAKGYKNDSRNKSKES